MSNTTNKPVIFLAFANDRDDSVGYLRNLPDEARRLREVLDSAERAGLCELVFRSNCTAGDILKVFQDPRYRNRIAVFHYGGHANGYQLLLESAQGLVAAADAGGFAAFLSQQQGLRLVFLNGCSTQQQTQGLLDANISLVISTSRSIDDQVAVEFSYQFYQGLAGGANVRTAYKEAAAAVQITKGGDARALYLGNRDKPQSQLEADRWPWNLYLREGSERADQWNLPGAVNDPLFGLPPLDEQKKLPESPFRHLNWFTKEHAEVFFGRGHQIRELYDRLTAPRTAPIVLFYGQSGVGKSSVLDAGLIPRLEQDYEVRYLRRTAGGLLDTLQLAFLPEACDVPIATAWRVKEAQAGKPLIVFLDQVEEHYTRPIADLPGELEQFLEVIKATFVDANERPQGKLVLGFRKEWLAELEAQLVAYELPRTKVFLEPLDRRGIIEVVQGPARSERLVQHFGLTVDVGVAETIADDLLEDRGSAIAPTLQILLTKMWTGAAESNYEHPRFTLDLYQQLKRDGILLRDFLDQQITAFRRHFLEVVDSGLLLDILAMHTTPLGTADQRNVEQLRQHYTHLGATLSDLLQQCQDLYLLTVVVGPQKESTKTTRLSHDTLAPLVRERFEESDKPGQRARRILDSRSVDWADDREGTPLDQADLAVVEQGVRGTRTLDSTEQRLLQASRELRAQLLRKQKLTKIAAAAAAIVIVVAAGIAVWKWSEAAQSLQEIEALVGDKSSLENDKAALASEIEESTNRMAAIDLALRSQSLRLQSPESSLQLAIGALATTNRENSYVPEAETALRQVLATIEGRRLDGHFESASRDGELFLTRGADGSFTVCKFGVTEPIWTLAPQARYGKLTIEGNWIATLDGRQNTAYLWNLADNASDATEVPCRWMRLLPPNCIIVPESQDDNVRLARLTSPHAAIATFRQYEVSDDGRCVAALDSAGDLNVHRFDAEDQPPLHLGNFTNARPLAVANDGQWCVIVNSSDLLLIRATDPVQPITLKSPPNDGFQGPLPVEDPATDGTRWLATIGFDPKAGTGLMGLPTDVFLWDLKDPEKEPLTVHRHTEKIQHLSFANGKIISADTREIIVTELSELGVQRRLRGEGANISTVNRSPDGRYLVAGFEDHSIRRWDTQQLEQEPRVLYGHNTPPLQVAMSRNNEWVVSAGESESRLWQLLPGIRGIEPIVVSNNEPWRTIAFSSDSQQVFVGGSTMPDRNVPIRSVLFGGTPGVGITTLRDEYHDLMSLEVSPDGKWLVAFGDYVSDVLLFSLGKPDSDPVEIPLVGPPYTDTRFSNDSRWLILESDQGNLACLYSLDRNEPSAKAVLIEGLHKFELLTNGRVDSGTSLLPQKVIIEPDCEWLLTLSRESNLRLWKISGGVLAEANDRTPEFMAGSSIGASSPDGRWVIVVRGETTATLVDLSKPLDVPIDLPEAFAKMRSVDVSADAQWILAGQRLWKRTSGSADSVDLHVGDDSFSELAFTRDSRWLIGLSYDGRVLIWQLMNDGELVPIELHTSSNVQFVANTSDSACLITADDVGVVRLHDLRDTSRKPVILGTHQGPVLAMGLSPNDERLATLGADHMLKVWRLWKPGADGLDRLGPLIEFVKVFVEQYQLEPDGDAGK